MHSLIDQDMVDRIRRTGNTLEDLPDRLGVLQKHKLPYDMELEVSLEDTDIVIEQAAEKTDEFDLEFDNSSGEETEDTETRPEPQIFLLSSGEISPEFSVRFYILGVETSYLVNGLFDGSLKTEISEL